MKRQVIQGVLRQTRPHNPGWLPLVLGGKAKAA